MEKPNLDNKFEGAEKIKLEGIIAGFPGIGKSWFVAENPDLDVVDLDSAVFREDDPGNWPDNYIEKIIECAGQQEAVFVSTYPEVLRALITKGFSVTVVYPSIDQREDYQERYIERAKDPDAAQKLANSFDQNLEGLKDVAGCTHIALQTGQYLSNIIET